MIISKENRKKILSASCIEDVIGHFVKLRKSGMNYRGLSPFSNEKTPSLIVSPTKKIWKDFSSGKGGDVISFLMEHENFSYVESLHYLANKYNIRIEEKNNNDHYHEVYHQICKKLYLIQDYAKSIFIKQLFLTEEGKKNGLNYLIRKRKFDMKSIRKFELGYASYSWNFFTKNALDKGFKIQDIEKTGLTIIKKDNYFDSFRKRIMFPIHDLSGRVVGFGGRTIVDPSNFTYTKYINSSESFLFQKSKILYGLFQSKKYIVKENFCYLVEGYTDVISFHQNGIKNVVSSSGISLTIDQILLIKKFTKNVILFYDGDISGMKASFRVINMMLEKEMNIRILFLNNEEDPDSLSRKYSMSQLKDFLVKNSYNFISYKKKIYDKLYQKKYDPIKKSFLISNILNSISKIKNILQKELFLQEASRILNVKQEILNSELERIMKKNIKEKFIVEKNEKTYNLFSEEKKKENILIILEKKLIKFISFYGNKIIKKGKNETTVFQELLHFFKNFNLRFYLKKNQEIFDNILSKNVKKKETSDSNVINVIENEKYYSLSKWEKKGIEVPSHKENIDQYIVDLLLRYQSQYILKLIQEEIIKHNKNIENKSFIKRIMYLTNMKNKIHKKLHRYV
ncbi:DNA primase [Blattabacterium cuenoti]|uniref:DNA primase n=1 Tax=Blattabacterium cuenoti TaxID=1653831 RepID=UPI001EEA4115|nr:DNA primase [Blattabacterium cuenoti]